MSHAYRDHYFDRAKRENYRARAVYKLDEIQKKHKILRAGNRVLDLGAAPGSWVQLASGIVGPKGLIVGVDLKVIDSGFPGHVVLVQADIFDEGFLDALTERHAPFDVVLSDMAPATSGIRSADSARSELLFEQALRIVERVLRPGGHFLGKIFQGSGFHTLLLEVKKTFTKVKVVKPSASRKESKEIYILAMHYRKTKQGG
jgi:23S rRNA (uridine2552-2'-O)-methyltransferase